MDSMSAFIMGEANRGKPSMVFDWDRAAELIRERGAQEASAGLALDWDYTGGEILRAGEPIPKNETYVFLASTWAVPELEIGGELFDCWKWEAETDNWDADTYWPESALRILRGAQ